MLKGIVAGLLALLASTAQATTFGVHLASHHWPSRSYNNFNPGAYLVFDSGLTVGLYQNSFNRRSAYAGKTWEYDLSPSLAATVTAGGITGYARPLMPLLAPSLALRLNADARARLLFMPKTDQTNAVLVHFMLEVTR